MQKPNNHYVNQLTMISIPTEMLEEAGIDEFDGIEVFVDRGRIIIQQLEDDRACLHIYDHSFPLRSKAQNCMKQLPLTQPVKMC